MRTEEEKRARGREYMRRRRKAEYLGTWQSPMVNAAEAREHVLSLRRRGLSTRAIATMAGECDAQIARLIYPNYGIHPEMMFRHRAEKLLKLRFDIDVLPPLAKIPAAGTRRRAQALMAMGWPSRLLAEKAGVSVSRVRDYANSKKPHVQVFTARKVRDLYDELAMTPGPSVVAARAAKRLGYLAPLCWDEESIDDPDAKPMGASVRDPGFKRKQPKKEAFECLRCGVRITKSYRKTATQVCRSCADETREEAC